MAGMSIITSDEIMEITQLVFDRYYTELKRQLRKSELPEEETERHCTEILSKVYQAIQEQGVAAMSYEMDACAIPIINEEIRKILVPLHLNGYRNRRENPLPETPVCDEDKEEKKEAVQVVSNGQVQVYNENSEDELNPELRTEIRRILQQEFQLEPAQVKPVVVVVNVTAPQPMVQQEETAHSVEKVEQAAQEPVVTESAVTAGRNEECEREPEKSTETKPEPVMACEETIPYEVIEEYLEPRTENVIPDSELAATVSERQNVAVSEEPLPQLDIDIEQIVRSAETIEEEVQPESAHYGLWVPIIILLLLLLWLTIGMLMSYDIVPEFDLGYEWFNEVLFELF